MSADNSPPKHRIPPPCAIEELKDYVALKESGGRLRRTMMVIISMRLRVVFAVLVAVVSSLSDQAHSQAQNDHLIVPWERIGPITLNMTVAELFHAMGNPTNRRPVRGVEVYNWNNELSATVANDSSYITQICTFSPDYATGQGVHPGSTDLSVATLLGHPQNSRLFRAWWRYSYTNLYWPGLMVSVHLEGFENTDHLVWEICVNHTA